MKSSGLHPRAAAGPQVVAASAIAAPAAKNPAPRNAPTITIAAFWFLLPGPLLFVCCFFSSFAARFSAAAARFSSSAMRADISSESLSDSEQLWLSLFATLAAAAGFGVAYGVFVAKPALAPAIQESIPTLRGILQQRFYLDGIEAALITKPVLWFADSVLFRGVERYLLDGLLIEGVARSLRASAQWGLRYLQSGLTHSYVFFMIAGTVAVLGYLFR